MLGMAIRRAMWVEKRTKTFVFWLLAVLAAASIGMLAANPAHAATFTVNSTADTEDTTPDGTCDTCTLREAIQETNAAAGADTINFAIAGAGSHTISPGSALPDITDPVIINGYSQPGASPNTLAVGNDAVIKIELSGASAPTNTSGLKIKAANSTVKGLVISNWENGVFLDTGATDNQVMGNFIGTDASGTDLGNNIGVVALGADNTIGGTTAAARNIISNNGSGVQIGSATGGNKVQGNYIGTNAEGTTALGNNLGVVIDAAPSNIVGGTTAAARNIISGNSTFGIRIAFTGATLNKVQGNYIGISAAGDTKLGNGSHGVSIQADADNNTIGGTTAAARNIISGNGGSGLEIHFTLGSDSDPATGNRILSNSIYDNDALGIDLVFAPNDPPGVTANDDDDNDNGPNHLQNFPELGSAKTGRRATTIKGTLNSTANTKFALQFFSGPVPDPSGNGEGQKFLGQKSVTTDSSGDATFTFKTKKKVPKGQVVTATATNVLAGDTSEFSNAVTAS